MISQHSTPSPPNPLSLLLPLSLFLHPPFPLSISPYLPLPLCSLSLLSTALLINARHSPSSSAASPYSSVRYTSNILLYLLSITTLLVCIWHLNARPSLSIPPPSLSPSLSLTYPCVIPSSPTLFLPPPLPHLPPSLPTLSHSSHADVRVPCRTESPRVRVHTAPYRPGERVRESSSAPPLCARQQRQPRHPEVHRDRQQGSEGG